MTTFLICLGIGVVAAFIVTGIMAAQLKSVRPNRNAGSYIRENSMTVTHSRDMFLYSTVSRTEKPRSNNRK